MKNFIKFLVVAILLVPCFMLAGCGNTVVTSTPSSSSGSSSSSSSNDSSSQVTITLQLNGGSGLSKLSYSGTAGSSLDLPTPTHEEATFEGWYNGKTKITNDDVFPSKSQTWTAKYALNSAKECSIDVESASVMSSTTSYRWFKTSELSADELILFESMLQYSSEVNVSCSFESMAGGGNYKINLQGANDLPNIASETYNNTSYEKHTITTTAGVGLFEPKASGTFFALTKLMVGNINVRNIKATFTFTLPQGSLI